MSQICVDDMSFTGAEERKRVETLARNLGIEIPGSIRLEMWALPILEKLSERIEDLERKLDRNIII